MDDVRAFFAAASLREATKSIGYKRPDDDYLEQAMGLPQHLREVVDAMGRDRGEVPAEALDSIPYYSLCRGLFLPLSSLTQAKAAELFGVVTDPPPDTKGREDLLVRFFSKGVGLTVEEKIGAVLGDPFMGRPCGLQRDSLIRLLLSIRFWGYKETIDRLSVVGDVAALFAEAKRLIRGEPPLTAAEVFATLRLLPEAKRNQKFDLLRSLLERCGKLEAYFLAKLVLRRAGFGFDYQGPVLSRALAHHFRAPEEAVSHALALTDAFRVARTLASEGVEGLRAIRLTPLSPVRPALAGGSTDDVAHYPVWVERKYDGIRFMLHKSTDVRGASMAGAYTRTRRDWLELVPGLDASIRALPARGVILDGELHGVVVDLEGARPASVYEVYAWMQGDRTRPVQLRFTAFDLLYLEGRDLTGLPLSERRRILSILLAGVAGMPLPVPIALAEGQLAEDKDDINRLFLHFRAQGYEGVIAKDLRGAYRLADRDPTWLKRKPEVTLDLVLLAAMFAVTSKENVGAFGSYAIGARRPDGSFEDVGDVAGVDRERDMALRAEIARDGLFTGKRVERKAVSGVRAGLELRPHIVVTVKFEGIARDGETGRLGLRSVKIAALRADKSADEADTIEALESIYLQQRVG